MSEEEDILKDQNISMQESALVELFQILYNENLFGLLSEGNYEAGKKLLESKFGIDFGNLKNMGLKFSVDEHLNIARETLKIHEKQSDFWIIVVKIVYLMLAIERNPMIAQDIDDLKEVLK